MVLRNAARRPRKKRKPVKLAPFPPGPFDLIYADPPWDYESGWKKASQGGMTYPTMKDDEICAMPVKEIASDRSILLMWCTWKKLGSAIRVMESWGFRYGTGLFVWLKTYKKPRVVVPVGSLETGEQLCKLVETDDYRTLVTNEITMRPFCGLGRYTKTSTEFVLIGFRGKWSAVADKAINQIVVEEHPRKHSKKPQRVYELIDKLYPGRRKIELFARGKARDGWIIWGNQAGRNKIQKKAEKKARRKSRSAMAGARVVRRISSRLSGDGLGPNGLPSMVVETMRTQPDRQWGSADLLEAVIKTAANKKAATPTIRHMMTVLDILKRTTSSRPALVKTGGRGIYMLASNGQGTA